MNDRLDAALKPSAFDWASCIQCKQPVPVPLSVLLAAPKTPGGEPRSFAIHTRCEREHAAIDHGDHADDAEADGEGAA